MNEVITHGPLFDGRAEAALDRGIHAARDRIADEGKDLVTSFFAADIKRDRGVFLTHFRVIHDTETFTTISGRKVYSEVVEVDPETEAVVTNDIASYGAWLEGVGSRNEVTRFRGYHDFRKAADELDHKAKEITEKVLHEGYLEEMN